MSIKNQKTLLLMFG